MNKDPGERLMDMVAGWSVFIDKEYTDEKECNRVGDLYQQAGILGFRDPDEEDIRTFLIEQVLPVLMGERTDGAAAATEAAAGYGPPGIDSPELARLLRMSAWDLLRLPAEERDRILRLQAEVIAPYYEALSGDKD